MGHDNINSDLSRLCVYIRHDLKDVLKEINDITGQTLTVSPSSCISINNPPNIPSNTLEPLKILLVCARRILLKGVSEEPPNIT